MNILYIEDNVELSLTIKEKLMSKYNVETATAGEEGLKKAENKEFDLIIVDFYLPDLDGISICKKIREFDAKVAILMFTTNDDKKNIVNALDAGADDYLTKPFVFQELEARIRALVRRLDSSQMGKALKLGELVVDTAKQIVICEKHIIDLSRQEYLLLRYLLLNRGKLTSRQELYEHVWGKDDYYNSNTIDVHIRRLRKKLKQYSKADYIRSIYGLGYRTEIIGVKL